MFIGYTAMLMIDMLDRHLMDMIAWCSDVFNIHYSDFGQSPDGYDSMMLGCAFIFMIQMSDRHILTC